MFDNSLASLAIAFAALFVCVLPYAKSDRHA